MREIAFKRYIYSETSIKETIDAYKGIATITANIENDQVLITFLNCKYDEDRTIKEFENYLIGVENFRCR